MRMGEASARDMRRDSKRVVNLFGFFTEAGCCFCRGQTQARLSGRFILFSQDNYGRNSYD